MICGVKNAVGTATAVDVDGNYIHLTFNLPDRQFDGVLKNPWFGLVHAADVGRA